MQIKLYHFTHDPMQYFQHALAYFVTAISYKRKMLMKWVPVVDFMNSLRPKCVPFIAGFNVVFSNSLAYFVTAISYARKMFIKWVPVGQS
jgi:hypothetical protein